jgi:hypothetical protein
MEKKWEVIAKEAQRRKHMELVFRDGYLFYAMAEKSHGTF